MSVIPKRETFRQRLRRWATSKPAVAVASAVLGIVTTLVSVAYKRYADRPALQGEPVRVARLAPDAVVDLVADPDLRPLMAGLPSFIMVHNPQAAALLVNPQGLKVPDDPLQQAGANDPPRAPALGVAAGGPVGVPRAFTRVKLSELGEVAQHAAIPEGVPIQDPALERYKADVEKAKTRIAEVEKSLTAARGCLAFDVLVTNTGGRNLSLVKARLAYTGADGTIRLLKLVLPESGKPIVLAAEESRLVRAATLPFDSKDEGAALREVDGLVGTGTYRIVFTDSHGKEWPVADKDFVLP